MYWFISIFPVSYLINFFSLIFITFLSSAKFGCNFPFFYSLKMEAQIIGLKSFFFSSESINIIILPLSLALPGIYKVKYVAFTFKFCSIFSNFLFVFLPHRVYKSVLFVLVTNSLFYFPEKVLFLQFLKWFCWIRNFKLTIFFQCFKDSSPHFSHFLLF